MTTISNNEWHPKDPVMIYLSKGKWAIIDEEDYERVNQHRWHHRRYIKPRSFTEYALHANTRQPMHRFILKLGKGRFADHRNRNGLDNRKSNLRPATYSQNNMNRIFVTKTSKYKGVYKDKNYEKWIARIKFNKKQRYLGYFDTEIEAAKAYNDAALKEQGEFACLNDLSIDS